MTEGKPARTDNRGQWTIKHADVGPEFQTLVRMAAERQGMTVGAFVVETLQERAHAVLKGDGEGTPRGTPPARLEDVAADLTARVGEMFGTLAQQQAERLAQLERLGAIEQTVAAVTAGTPAGTPQARRPWLARVIEGWRRRP
jgi:hypothetical protein